MDEKLARRQSMSWDMLGVRIAQSRSQDAVLASIRHDRLWFFSIASKEQGEKFSSKTSLLRRSRTAWASGHAVESWFIEYPVHPRNAEPKARRSAANSKRERGSPIDSASSPLLSSVERASRGGWYHRGSPLHNVDDEARSKLMIAAYEAVPERCLVSQQSRLSPD